LVLKEFVEETEKAKTGLIGIAKALSLEKRVAQTGADIFLIEVISVDAACM